MRRYLCYVLCVCVSYVKKNVPKAAVLPVFNSSVAAHLHDEWRPGSLVESPRGVLQRPRPGGEESLLPCERGCSTATCEKVEEEDEGGRGIRDAERNIHCDE